MDIQKAESAKEISLIKGTYELELFKAREEVEKMRMENEILKNKINKVQRLFMNDQDIENEGASNS